MALLKRQINHARIKFPGVCTANVGQLKCRNQNVLPIYSKEIIMTNHKNYVPGSFLQFSTSIIFIIFYIVLYAFFSFYHHAQLQLIFMNLPLCTVLMSIAYAFFTFKKSMLTYEKIRIFFSGSINQSTSYFYTSFIGATVFSHMLAKIGSIVAMVNILTIMLPSYYVLPSLFILVAMFSMIIRSWSVCIIVGMPIAYGVGQFLQINPALIGATILSGTIFGYQISMPADKIMKYDITKELIWLIFPAAVATLILLSMYSYHIPDPLFYTVLRSSLLLQDYISLVPIVIFLVIAFLKVDLIVNLFISSIFSIFLGLVQYKISDIDLITSLFEGYYSQKEMVKLMIFCILLSGLTNVINYNHGYHYLTDLIKHKIKNTYLRRLSIIFIMMIISCTVALDILSINILMPMMKKLSDRYALSSQKSLALLYVISTTVCCLLPYASIVLLSSYLGHTSILAMIQYMFYPIILLVWTMVSLFVCKYQKTSKKYFYRSGN